MKKLFSKLMNFVKKHKISTALVGICVVLVSWWGVVSYMPHPLGDGMAYLGKRDYGCWVGFCDSEPGTTYYYATNLTPREVTHYFSKTSVVDDASLDPAIGSGQEPGSYDIMFELMANDTSKKISIYYISNAQRYAENFNYKTPNQNHIIEIDSRQYDTAKNSL